MMPDKSKANLPMIKALKAIRAKKPSTSGKRAAAFSLNNNKSGSNSFFVLCFLPRAEIVEKYFC